MKASSVIIAFGVGGCILWASACKEEETPAPDQERAASTRPAPDCDAGALQRELQERGSRAMLNVEQARRAAALVQRASRCKQDDKLLLPASHLFKRPQAHATFAVMRESGLPALRHMVDRVQAGIAVKPEQDEALLAGLEVLAVYGVADDLPRIQKAVDAGLRPDDPRWRELLIRGLSRHPPLAGILFDNLKAGLPPGFIGASLMALANRLCAQGKLSPHPFDSPEGLTLLAPWIAGEPPPNHSWRISAVASLAYLKRQDVGKLLQTAEQDPNLRIQVEAAWVRGKRGQASGLDKLQAFAADARTSLVASAYLKELGQAERIPAAARKEDFKALAKFSAWLSRPGEFDRPPDEIRQVDERSMAWPPTGDTRALRVFAYRYGPREGYGVQGGDKPFSMSSEGGPLLASLPDIYAMACCQQLKEAGDARGENCDATRGRALLGFPPAAPPSP